MSVYNSMLRAKLVRPTTQIYRTYSLTTLHVELYMNNTT